MDISYAMLGILSWKPSTGYELKKIFEESTFMPWSGNNNQIYKNLQSLHESGLITSETVHQDGIPSKKIYTITKKGMDHLKIWLSTAPVAPTFKKPFLVQLAWSDMLTKEELEDLLTKYEKEVENQLVIQKDKYDRENDWPNRNTKETFIWNMIAVNLMSSLQCELDWVQKLKRQLSRFE